MGKLIVSVWATLDGVFDAASMPQWEVPYNSEDKWNYIKEGILSCDALLLGRTTYEMFAGYWSAQKNNEMGVADKLNAVSKFVVSSTLGKADWNNSTLIKDNVIEQVKLLKQQSGGRILISGSSTLVHSLIDKALIDEYEFIVHPIIMGKGIKFFKENTPAIKLELIEIKSFSSGVTMQRYKPV